MASLAPTQKLIWLPAKLGMRSFKQLDSAGGLPLTGFPCKDSTAQQKGVPVFGQTSVCTCMARVYQVTPALRNPM